MQLVPGPAILVIRLGSKGGNLELAAAFDDNHYPELTPDRNSPLEKVLDLRRQSGGGDIIIIRFAAQQRVTHAAAHPERRESAALEPADNGERSASGRIGRHGFTDAQLARHASIQD